MRRKLLFKLFSFNCVLMFLVYSTAVYAGSAGKLGAARASSVLNDLERHGKNLKIQVTGTVRDSVGFLPGVSIKVRGTNLGTTTNETGKYILDVPDGNVTLIFSMVGFEPREIPLNGRTKLDVILKPSGESLGEVVVVAYGKQKKTDLIGAVTTVDPKILKTSSSNLTTALAGRVGGVIAFQRSGEPGADNASFFIRGVTTFGYKAEPLILIDNIELSTTELARLQPDDIASFSILKDATATSLYGAKGANGVILVSTKEGKAGKPKFSFRLENPISSNTRNVELADPITYMRLNNEAVLTRTPLGELPYTENRIDATIAGKNPQVYPAVNWREELIKDYTSNQRMNLNLTGGGEAAQYYLAGTFNQDNGLLKVDRNNDFNNNIKLKSYGLRSNVNINVTKSTRVGVRLYGTFDDYNGPIDEGAALFRKVMRTVPTLFPARYTPDAANSATKHTLFGNSLNGDNFYINPYADMVSGYKDKSKSLMLAQFELTQNLSFITEGLSINALGNTNKEASFDVKREYNPFFYSVSAYNKFDDSFVLRELNSNSGTETLDYSEGTKVVKSNTTLQTALTYNRIFQAKHSVSALLNFKVLGSIEANANTLQKSLPSRSADLAGRATYSFNNRYFAEFNFGYNGSERFYETQRFGFFPSAGIAWAVSEEKFMAPVKKVLSKLKLRGTYGLVGNGDIGSSDDRFFYLSNISYNGPTTSFGTDYSYGRTGVNVTRYENRDITFERSKKLNIGLDLGLFNKFDLQADYFTEQRTGILQTRASLPKSLGLTAAVRANVGAASASGIDISSSYSQFFGTNFSIQALGNFTYATSKYEVYEEPIYAEKNLSRVGYPIRQTWGYIAERLFVDEADVANSPIQTFGTYSAGDIKYKDVNGDGQVTTRDRVPIGYPTVPEITYGFGFSSTFKSFDLACFFQGSARSSFWMNTNGSTSPFAPYFYAGESNVTGVPRNQLLKVYADSHWSEENRDIYALYPRLSTQVLENNNQTSTWFMRNGAFLRVKSVLLGYTLPKKLTKKLLMESVRFYAEGTNLGALSKFKTWDVEMGSDGLGYPLQRVYNFGLQVSF
ncbi:MULTISPECIES: SusC/RagA family TonB-linked outer membrane protein [Pedobacter]|nr:MULTISPECIES: TonB-dependent receptor [Pedobacter]MBB5437641.1 TonB-linked SusC/RagA family outer membrane protein [Pedobacter sp. AK017]